MKKTVTVIGGGLGGLSAVVSLAQEGYSVEVYEQNEHLGGKLNRLEKDGFGFDLGPSILTMPWIFERLFENSGKKMEDYITIQRLETEWRSFFPDGTVLDLMGDLEKMHKVNPNLSTSDMNEYQDLLMYSRGLYDLTEKGYFDKGIDTTWEVFKEHGMIGSLKGFDYFLTMQEAINERISNPHFQDMLGYFIKYVGSSSYDAPAILNMLIYMQHEQGAWYVPGGMHYIAEGIVRLAKEIGVTFHTGAKVVKMEKEDDKITAIVLADGTKVTSDLYVSNMEVIPVYEQLLKEDKKYTDKLTEKFEPAASGLVLHLGVKKEYPQLAHHNFFFSHDSKANFETVFHKKQLPEDPTIYLVNVNKTDPGQALPGHENIKILPHIPYIQDDPFTQKDYEDLRERVLVKLERMGLDGLRDNIVVEDMWTPHDIEDNYSSHRGAIYGTVSDKKKNHGFKHPKMSEKYDNLYFVGGTVNPGGGMPMVTLSGQQVRDKIVERDENEK